MRIYLIDGYSLLYRAFYALPQSISTSSGLPTNALYGFTSMLLKLIESEEEVGLGVVWDGGMPKFRLEIFPEYKAQRSAMPEELRSQLDHLDEILDAMNVPAIRAEGFEADDALATMSRQVPDDVELFIVTGDQDAMQLVDGRVKVLRTTRGVSETKAYGRNEVVEEYGVTPEQIPDFKALTGDSSDNIPGVRGIGPKGAANLLEQFGTLGGVYENLENIAAKGTRKKLEDGRESAFMSLELAKMRFDVPVKLDPEALRFEGISPNIRDITRRYEFRTLESRLTELPVAGGEQLPPVERLEVSISEEPVELSFEAVAASPIEDDSGRWCVAVSEDEVRITEGVPDGHLKVHDSKRLGVREADFDTYLAAYLVKPGLGSYELETLAAERGLSEVDVAHEDRAVAEAARRAALVYALSPRLQKELEEMGLARLFYDVEIPLADVLGEIEEIGMPVDAETLEEVGEDLDARIADVERDIYEGVGHPFNIGSPKQLGEVLFEEMSIPPVRKTKTGYSTDAKVLQQLAIQHPIADRIIEYRELTKLRGTYIDGLLKLITDEGRIHSTLQQTRAATGRLSSDSPNLQNIPVRTEMGVRIRDAFTASPGRKLVVADYSQIELRILAHMTGEPALVESFTKGEDIHTRTASEVFDVRMESVTPELRRRAKMVNFGILYGISGFGLATRLGNVHPAEAERYIKRYFERYPKVTEFMEETLAEAEEKGKRDGTEPYVTTLFGRRRYVKELRDPKKNVRKLGERIAFNARVQGTAADIIKVAMVDLAPRLRSLGADMIMQVHDELVFDVDEDMVYEVAALAADRMVAAYDLEPPLEVEAKAGDRWGQVSPL